MREPSRVYLESCRFSSSLHSRWSNPAAATPQNCTGDRRISSCRLRSSQPPLLLRQASLDSAGGREKKKRKRSCAVAGRDGRGIRFPNRGWVERTSKQIHSNKRQPCSVYRYLPSSLFPRSARHSFHAFNVQYSNNNNNTRRERNASDWPVSRICHGQHTLTGEEEEDEDEDMHEGLWTLNSFRASSQRRP